MPVAVPPVVDQPFQVEDVTVTELAKLKVGFATRLINSEELVVDALHSGEFNTRNQAVLEFFLSIQEHTDKKLDSGQYPIHGPRIRCRLRPQSALSSHAGVRPVVNIKSLLKTEEGAPFFIIPVGSNKVFPHFKDRSRLA